MPAGFWSRENILWSDESHFTVWQSNVGLVDAERKLPLIYIWSGSVI